LSILPAGKSKTSHPSALLASKQMPQLLNDLKVNHDVIIIDAPPAPVGADSWALARMADRVLFIVKQGQTNELEVEDALSALAISLDKVNVVLNMVRIDADPTFSSRLVGYYSAGARH
jgi:Mrp family chromosome partitioning ATPase